MADAPECLYLGERADGEPFIYDLSGAANYNVGLCGMTGAGKSHLIRLLMRGYHQAGVTCYAADVHGDFATIPGVPDEAIRHLEFRNDGSGATINPLRVTPYDGPNVVSRQFVEAARLFSSSLGARQQYTLRSLVAKLYDRFGIAHNDPNTWTRDSPQLSDLLDVVRHTLEDVTRGLPDSKTAKAVKKATRRAAAKEMEGENEERDKSIYEAGEALYRAYQADEKSVDKDAIFPTRDRLQALYELLQEMQARQIFGEDAVSPAPRPGLINRFAMEDLVVRDKQVLSYLIIDRVFNYMMRSAKTLEPTLPRGMVVLDEGKIVAAISQNQMSPLNRAATEGRKFGMGILLGVQSTTHMTEDVLDSCGLFCLLRQHHRRVDEAARAFRISGDRIAKIEPRRDALIAEAGGGFLPVRVAAQ